MAQHANHALRSAVRSVVSGLTGVTDIVSGVYETAPQSAAFPYISFGDGQVRDWSSKSFSGHEHQLVLNCWSDEASLSQVLEIHDAIKVGLVKSALTLTDHHLAVFFLEDERFARDQRRGHRLGILRYRAMTHPILD